MNVLVTGGAGFIGSHLIERLLARDSAANVVCLDDFNPYYDPALKRANVSAFVGDRRVNILDGSFCSPAAMVRLFAERKFERVLHLGAYAGVRASLAQPELF